MIAGVDVGFDLPLAVELQQPEHGPGEDLLVSQVAQVEATHGLVGLHQFQGVEGELVVPGLSHGQQVLLLARHTVGSTWDKGEWKIMETFFFCTASAFFLILLFL